MSYEIRKYQEDHIERIVKHHAKHRTVCAQLPTGGGKTVEFSKLAHRFYHATGKSVLILVHREELMHQTAATMKAIFDEEMPFIKAGTKWVRNAPAFIGMAESVYKRIDAILHETSQMNLGLIIIDEAHNALFNKLHRCFTKEYITGFTATPLSSSKREPMNKYYGAIAVGPSIKELIAMGNLSQNITRSPKEVVDRAKIALATTGDFDIGSMANEYRKAKYVNNTVLAYTEMALHKKTIVYNVNVEHSKEVTNVFNLCGFKAKHVDGMTPENERADIFKWFHDTPDGILCNVGVATMGFDEPTVECIIVNRATTSMPLWLQMCGRGGRPIDEFFIQKKQEEYPYPLHKKKTFTIIDMGGNCITHGDWSDERDWQYIFDNPEIPSAGNGIAPVKECPSCGGYVHAATVRCKLPVLIQPMEIDESGFYKTRECGHIFDRHKYEELELLEEFVTVSECIDLEKLLNANKHRRNYYVFFEMGRKIIDAAAEDGVTIDDKRKRFLFNQYTNHIEKWFRLVFPEKYYDRKWHENLALTFFTNYFEKIFKQEPVNA